MKHYAIIGIMCLLFIGCTQVELCDVGVHPHQHELVVEYNWPDDMLEEERPDSMYILANRLFNNLRYQFSYNLLTEEGRLMRFWSHDTHQQTFARSSRGDEETEGENTEGEDTGNEDTGNEDTGEEGSGDNPGDEILPDSVIFTDFALRRGFYQMLSFNHTEAVNIDSLDNYMASNMVNSNSLGISYNEYEYPQYKGEAYTRWTDFNKGYPYLENVGPIFMAEQTVEVENQHPVRVTFDTELITQEIKFHFDIQLSGKNVVVDSVRAEASGISRFMKLVTRHIDMDATRSGRMIFDLTPEAMSGDSVVTCIGKIHVPGMMNSEDQRMKTGPGLLYVAAYVHTTDADGKIVRKTCYAGINLRSYILEQPLTKLTEDGYHHVISQPKVSIYIESPLPISQEEILGAKDPDYNIEYWFKEEDGKGDYDLEV